MKNFCFHPWLGLDISPQGHYKPCCKFIGSLGDSLDLYKSNQKLFELKDYHLKDLRHPGCKRCWDDEDAGMKSKRLIDKEYHLLDRPTDIVRDKIRFLSISFGNTCNLACRTCSSYASSRWSSEIKNYGPHDDQIWFKHNKFYKHPNFLTETVDSLDNFVHIDIPGGEPFLSDIDEHISFLNLIKNRSETVSLHYTTNGTNFPSDTLINLWKNFKQVDIQISIDGIGKMFEYLRWPAKWDLCYTNVKKYKSLIDSNSNFKLSISHTVSILNILDLPDFYEWCSKENLPSPHIGMVSSPKEYNIMCLPDYMKKIITYELMKKGSLTLPVINFMNKENLSSDYFYKLMSQTSFLDTCREQNFEESCSKIAELIKKAH